MAFVQKAVSADPAAGATTRSVTISAGGAGNHIIGNVSWQASTNELSNVKDNNGVTYTIQDTVLDATNGTACASFYKENISGAPTSIIATFASSQLSRIGVVEWSGLAVSASLDAHNGSTQTASGTALTLGSITPTVAGDLLFGFASCDSVGSTTLVAANASDGTVCTLQNAGTGNENHYDETGVQAAAGAVQMKFTANASGQAYVTTTMAFKAAAVAVSNLAPLLARPIQFHPYEQSPFLNKFPSSAANPPPQPPDTVVGKLEYPIRFRPFVRAPWLNRLPLALPPLVVGDITALSGFGSLTLTGRAPSLALRVFSGFGGITLNGQAPSLRITVKPGFGSLVLTGPAPKLAFVDRPGFGSIILTGPAPTTSITSGTTALPGRAQITLTGFAPALAIKIFPGFGSILLTGKNPSLKRSDLAGFGSIVLTGKAPSLAFVDRPGFGSVVLTGKAPSLRRTTLVGFGSVILTGKAPAIQLSGSIASHPGFGALLLSGRAPVASGGISSAPTFPGGTLWGYWPHKRRRKPTLLEILADVIEEEPPPKLAEPPSRRQKARAKAEAQRWAEEIVGRAQREAESYELNYALPTIEAALRQHAATLIDAAIQRRLDQEEEEALLLLLSHYH